MVLWLLIPFLLFVPGISDFFFSPGSEFSDLVISHFPNALYLHHSLASGLGIPLWSNSILSGYPFAADPLSGLWYPPLWICAGLPIPLVFNLLIIAHMLWGGLGMFFWLKAEGIKPSAAMVGALAFEIMPKLVSHFAAGHITLVFAVTWTPWLLLAEKKWSYNRSWRFLLRSPGFVLGIICLADIRWAAYAGIFWIAYSSLNNLKKISEIPGLLILWSGQVVLALLIAAPLIFPLLEYTGLTTRTSLTPADVFTLSLPPARLLGLLFPDPGTYAEWSLYPGSIAVISLGFVLIIRSLRKKLLFWLMVLVFSLIFALGNSIPLLSWLAYLPGISWLRVPARALFLSGFAFAVITAHLVNYLLSETIANRKPLNLFLVGLTSFVLLMTAGVAALTGSLPISFGWGAVSICISAVVSGYFLNSEKYRRYLAPGFMLIILINLGLVNRLALEPHSLSEVLSEGSQAAAYLEGQAQPFRTYSPSYSIPQQTAASAGLQTTDGIDPLQLASYVTFMQSATGISSEGYSVTLPPYKTANPSTDNQAFIPNTDLLGWLNVKFILSDYDLAGGEGLVLKEQFGETRIYENPLVKPHAWIPPYTTSTGLSSGAGQDVNILKYSPNLIILNAKGPGTLVLSEIVYPGWHVLVDQKEAKIVTVMDILRGVQLPAGEHTVEFVFQPTSVLLGLILGLLTWCILVAIRER